MVDETKRGLTMMPSGVPGLDEVLGGGFCEYSFNIIAGEPGSGKTTLIHQMLFANATAERPALYFTALGEPPLKMLRYQQQMAFYDAGKVGTAIRFVDLSEHVRHGDYAALMAAIVEQVEANDPAIVVIDSFRSAISVGTPTADYDLRRFIQELAMHLASSQTTTFLLGEYEDGEVQANPLVTLCDGLMWLYQTRERNAVIRKLQVKKVRGQASMPGVHTFRITGEGVRVFARSQRRPENEVRVRQQRRVATGVAGLDSMMMGGVPAGDTVLVAGPTGVGKTMLCTHFIANGLAEGEPAVVALFEEHPDDFVQRAKALGMDFEPALQSGLLRIVYLRPLDLPVDEAIYEIRAAIEDSGAKRFVIDSITGLEVSLSPSYGAEFREALFRMVNALPGTGVTSFMIVEVTESFHDLRFSPHAISFMTENIVLLRYVEIDGELKKVMAVVKMRRSGHLRELREYDLGPTGMVVYSAMRDWRGVLTGVPEPHGKPGASAKPGGVV